MSNAAINGFLGKAAQAILKPLVQTGFAFFSVLLLAVVAWTIHTNDRRFDRLLETQRETNQVIERNTAAITELSRVVHSSYGRTP